MIDTERCCPDPFSRKNLLSSAHFLPGDFQSHPSWGSLSEQGRETDARPVSPSAGHSDEMFAPKLLAGLAKLLLGQHCGSTTSSAPSFFLSFPFTLINILHSNLTPASREPNLWQWHLGEFQRFLVTSSTQLQYFTELQNATVSGVRRECRLQSHTSLGSSPIPYL